MIIKERENEILSNIIYKGESFPIEYRKVILSYIKNAISKCNNGKYYEHFFKDTKQKDYCFSVILPNPTFTKMK